MRNKVSISRFGRFLFVLIASLYLLPALARAESLCGQQPHPQVRFNLYFTLPDVSFNFSKTKAELTEENQEIISDWLQENGVENIWLANHLSNYYEIGGLASGGYASSYDFELIAKPYDRYGSHYCPYFKRLTIDLFYRTIIFIPSDFTKGSCRYDITMAHEMEHHRANLMSVKEHSQNMESDIRTIVSEIENRGYVPHHKVQANFKRMQQSLRDAVEIYMDAIHASSREKNAKIDTPEEYDRLERAVKACEKKRQAP